MGCSQLGAHASPLCFTPALRFPLPNPPQTPQEPGRDKVWGEALQKLLLSRRQVRGKRVLAEKPQPLRARAVGEGMLSQQQGPVIQAHGLAQGPRPLPRAREHFPAPQASTPRFQRNAGWHWGFKKGSGCLFTSSSSTHACTHMHTHVLVPLHTPQTELLISLICSIAASQPALPCFAPCLRADLCPQVPLSPTSEMPLIPPQPFPDKPPCSSLMQTASSWHAAQTGCLHPSRLWGRTPVAWHGAVAAASCRRVPSGSGKLGLD